MRPFVSIIVAIYQAEPYLRRCLQSIVNQTLSNIELILVDDGSTDNSGQICDEYAEFYPHIKVFHKAHEGVSSARQVGVENAIGEYSIHCDADDWMEPNMVEFLYEKAKKTDADVVMCDIYLEYTKKSFYIKQKPSELDADTVLSELYHPLYASVWNKLVRHSLYEDLKVVYPKEIEHAEDLYALLQLYSHPIKTEYVPIALYHYNKVRNENSLTQNMDVFSVVRSVPYFEKLEAKTRPVVDKLKTYLMVDSYHRKTYQYKDWLCLYPSVRKKILLEGFYNPIRKWNYVEPGLALYHCIFIGKIYTVLIKGLLKLNQRIKRQP